MSLKYCMMQMNMKVETGDDFTRTKLYWYANLNDWKKDDKIRTIKSEPVICIPVIAMAMKLKWQMRC